ncbi:secretory carrier-associated membrane protein 2 isoform X2 [Alligator mississippiensis]|uniref:secretory carrier-associated membrane protein 2 isoform X2 n=1 Tax=Alligator mississippiensis TaxID=8496 RepID=UPI0009070333|nr:secretory carrier-associated membrane protein 2 isoform X2 [Alligator mississippiensis]
MSGFDTNPFADPMDVNPFQDPSVTQLTNANQGGLDEFNPFSENSRLTSTAQTVPATQPSSISQPAVLQPSVEPTPQLLLRQASKYLTPKFTSANEHSERQRLLGEGFSSQNSHQVKEICSKAVASAAQAELLQQQAELERKAAELDRKERELQSNTAAFNPRQNNWPPLPRRCPIKPCFYQDFPVDIPADYQRTCKMLYYLWMLHSVTLLLNLLACLAWFTVEVDSRGVDFGLSILWFILFTPCAFLCWYRPIYKAFRSDSSFSFFVFFFIFFCQIAIYIIQAVGIPGWGDSGWIAALSELKGNLAVSIIMMVVAAFFTLCAILSLFLLKQVHSLYRRTGASFQRAQEEFSQGILTNRNFQNAASGVASSAAQSAFRGN